MYHFDNSVVAGSEKVGISKVGTGPVWWLPSLQRTILVWLQTMCIQRFKVCMWRQWNGGGGGCKAIPAYVLVISVCLSARLSTVRLTWLTSALKFWKENGCYNTIYALTLHDCSSRFDHMVNPIRVFTCPLGYILEIHKCCVINMTFNYRLFMVLSLEGGGGLKCTPLLNVLNKHVKLVFFYEY